MNKTTAKSTLPAVRDRGSAIPMVDLRAQYASIKKEIDSAIREVLETQQFILGPNVAALEREIAHYCGRKFGVGVASGTDALILAIHAAGMGPGDEVLVPAFSFIATADTVSLSGAKPVFIDIQPDTFCIDPCKLAEKLTQRTRAIIPVHLYGQSADMRPILEFARKHGLKVIEDNAQALGAAYRGKRTGSLGDFGCISFFPSKNLGGYGDGGMIVTNSENDYRRLRLLRNHGSSARYVSEEQGWNSRLDELQAAILRVKLRHLDEWCAARRANAAYYDQCLKDIRGLRVPGAAAWGEHVYHQYTIRVERRDHVQKFLQSEGIASTVYYPLPMHLQPIYKQLGYMCGELPESERAAGEVLSLPMYPELTTGDIERVAETIARALES
ncbi:MAG TPA: DegT/DnrJ/EryC1/StrS family aminotransferase [Candidatus Acidoferrales bacterium]|jgi:dTDP-4-amino-4,6-dideoxygalactose transaminase|nr:DegT/DnrJ/EryC1/StrS family aminotransferase [Candidatus Acidoferrales bacterium]